MSGWAGRASDATSPGLATPEGHQGAVSVLSSAGERAALVLRARGVRRSFGLTEALRGIDLDVADGEILAVMGPSGSGKSTLLHVLAGVLVPDAGSVEYLRADGPSPAGRGTAPESGSTVISEFSEAGRARLRLTDFGFVFQFGQLLPDLSALDNVTVPLLLAGARRTEALSRAGAQLEQLGLADDSAKLPGELSGGQAQRVAVARALVTRPRVLFADEPTGSLDSLAAEKVMVALTSAARDAGTTVVLVTHDPRTAGYADREVVVRDGLISGAGR